MWLSSARNDGLDAAKGDYIAFVDSDDRIHPCYFEYLMKALNESGAKAVILNNVRYNEIVTSLLVHSYWHLG